ncbi:MAG: cold shock domain-containing protein [Balneolaceae bacterium]|nr:cold shock domain-containing protein [Balneolaceae bacterium]
MEYGKVKWFDGKKGFGFIEPENGGKDVFLHRNNVQNIGFEEGIKDGEEVEFATEETPKGLSAVDVYILE